MTLMLLASGAGIACASSLIAASSPGVRSVFPSSKTSRTGAGNGRVACAGAGTVVEAGAAEGCSVGNAGMAGFPGVAPVAELATGGTFPPVGGADGCRTAPREPDGASAGAAGVLLAVVPVAVVPLAVARPRAAGSAPF